MSSKCDTLPIKLWLGVVIVTCVGAALFVIGAAALNGSFFGAPASPIPMVLAGVSALLAVVFCVVVTYELSKFGTCADPLCVNECDNLRKNVMAISAVLVTQAGACFVVAIYAAIPWVAETAMWTIIGAFALQIALLFSAVLYSFKLDTCISPPPPINPPVDRDALTSSLDEVGRTLGILTESVEELKISINSLKSTNTFSIKDVDP